MPIEVEDWCVFKDADWDDVILYHVTDVSGQTIQVESFPIRGRQTERKTVADAHVLFRNPYRPGWEIGSEEEERTRQDAVGVRSITGNLIQNSKRQRTIDEVRAHIAKIRPSLNTGFIDGCLKCSLSSGALTVTRTNDDRFIVGLSESQIEHERWSAFAGSFAEELEAQAKRIELLIRHWATVGTYREELFRALLRKSVPERYHVATGFIFGYPRQLDVLIYDRLEYVPLFRENDLVVVEYPAVRAVIEVKSTLNSGQVNDALDKLHYLGDPNRPPIFKGIFAFKTEMSDQAIIDTICRFYDLEQDDLENFAALSDPSELLTAVCVLGANIVLSDFKELDIGERHILAPHLFTIGNVVGRRIQAAVFYDLLLMYLRDGNKPSGFSRTLTRFFESELERTSDTAIYEEPWGSYLLDDTEAEETLVKQIRALQKWNVGSGWSL